MFDPPYFDLERAPTVDGLTAWGSHDPGVPAAARPATLSAEVEARFGPYPAAPWVYAFVWPSAARTAEMGRALTQAVAVRTAAVRWLLAERLPEWDLAYVVVSEMHSAVEALWHGFDQSHPLHGIPSAAAAGEGIRAVYEAVDRLIAMVAECFPDSTVVAFNLHGMGANRSDPQSMLLLSELLLRDSGRDGLIPSALPWVRDANGVPLLDGDGSWESSIRLAVGSAPRAPGRSTMEKIRWRMGSNPRRTAAKPPPAGAGPLNWMPAAWYARHWPTMRAFALPSFYDGRVRVNLRGRESRGTVTVGDYERRVREIEQLIAECRDPRTGPLN